jgi:hypothetical protein
MWRPGWDCSGNPNQRRFRPLGDLPLFEKILCINGLGDILAVESGYEEGCKWGARKQSPVNSGAFLFMFHYGISRPLKGCIRGCTWVEQVSDRIGRMLKGNP